MKPRFLFDSARKDLLRRMGDPLALVLWIGIPVIIGGLIALVSSGGGTPRIRLLLADQDDTFLSDLIGGARERSAFREFLDIEVVELDEGRARIEEGDASALLVLPDGFTEAVLEDQPATVTLITNPAQQTAPAILQEGLELLVEGQFYAQRILGEPLRELAEGPPSGEEFFADERIAELSAAINSRMRRLENVLFPPVLELETEVGKEESEPFDFAMLCLPGSLLMSLLFVAQGMSEDLWKEKELGTLRRMRSTPQTLATFLAGKVLAGSLLMAAVSLAGLLVAVLVFGQAPSALVWGLVWCTFTGTALLILFTLIQLVATSRRAGSVLTSLVLFPLLMIGGSFFPFEVMPNWMEAIGRWTPNGLAVVHLKSILRGSPQFGALGAAALGIAAIGALCFLACVARVRGRFLTR